MARNSGARRLRFAEFELDPGNHLLRKNGEEIKLSPQPFKALALLASRPGELITREELRQAIWGTETVVDFEHGLNTCIRQIRTALGDEAGAVPIIETVPRLGYRFRADVTSATAGRQRRSWIVLPASLVAAAVAGIVLLAVIGALRPALWTSDAPVIAVLPFKNLSAEPDSEYFVDGLTDEIIRNLSVIDGLGVRSWTSSFTFKNRPRNIREVGELLNANLVVEGSVLRVGRTLRITAQLVRIADDLPLWAGRFDRELTDIFAIQDEISRSIVNELRIKLGRGQRRYDTNLEAYDLYLKAQALIARGDVSGVQKAAALFEQVIAKDSGFAPAHAGLANAYAIMSLPSGGIPFETAFSILRPAASRALQLDPLLAEAHAAMGWVYACERDWAGAEKAFHRAIDLNPSLTQTYTSYSQSTLLPLGRHEDALRLLHVALRNDPLSADVQREIGEQQLFAGRYDEAIATFQRLRAVDPEVPFVEMFLGRALLFAGRVAEALPVLGALDGRYSNMTSSETRANPRRGGNAPWLAHAYVRTGRRAEAEKLIARHAESLYRSAIVYAALGEKDRVFETLDRMAVSEPQRVGRLLAAPEMAALRGDPRFAAFRKAFGLP